MEKKTKFKKLYLRCTFTNEEMAGLATIMADKTQQLKGIEQNAKAAAAQFKSDKEAAQNEIDSAARKYRDGYEMRDVECEEVPDFTNGVIRYWRTDNGELGQEKKMTNEERQMRLDEIEADKVAGSDLPPEEAAGNESVEGAEHEAHLSQVGRIMSQERAVHQ